METGNGAAAFAIKASYFVVGAVIIVFVGMLILTVMHP
jgi:hypothetical protein